MKLLLRTHANNILMLYMGSNFKIGDMQGTQGRAAKLTACSSAIFSQRLTEACQAEPEIFSQFINRLFNTLNWTATELTTSLKVCSNLEFLRATAASPVLAWRDVTQNLMQYYIPAVPCRTRRSSLLL